MINNLQKVDNKNESTAETTGGNITNYNDLLFMIAMNQKLLETSLRLVTELSQKTALLENDTTKIINEYEKKLDDKDAIIEELKMLLHVHHSSSILGFIKRFFSPRLGVFYQYPPKNLVVPEHYSLFNEEIDLPVISIVTPAFNQGKFIERTLKSIIDQNYPKLEYIVQDGGSTDDTVKILQQYAKHFKTWESKRDNGQSHAINLGFQHATGEIMAYLNSDDLLLPGALRYVAEYFAQHPEVDVVYGHRIVINEANFEIGLWIVPPHDNEVLSWADYIPQETMFWRRSIWEKAGASIDESFRFAMDWDLILRFREQGANFVRLPRFLGAFRVHKQQKTSAEINEQGELEMQILRTRCHGHAPDFREITKHVRPYLRKHILMHKLYRMGILKY